MNPQYIPPALHTDLYQLTMAQGYWKLGMKDRMAAFDLFYRENPFKGGYAICSGLENIVNFITNFRFTTADLDYLSSLKTPNGSGSALFEPAFLETLATLSLSLDVFAIPEGTVVFPREPLVQIIGPLMQCQLLETAVLNLLNFPSLIATKAARVMKAALGDQVIEFGLRRAQGYDGGLTATRASFVGGVQATSNVLAGQLYGIPVRGTHAHSWIMAFDTELQSFEAYADAMPNNCIFLVDTYQTIEGVRHAIEVGKILKAKGYKLSGIRLDSGDLASLSMKARVMLDEAGFTDSFILGSGDLDEYAIERLKKEGAEITMWGVGTKLVTAYDQPALGGVYKLVAIQDKNGQWINKAKRSDDVHKQTLPGILRVKRYSKNGRFLYDELYDIHGSSSDLTHQDVVVSAEELLMPIFQKGKLVYELPKLTEIQAHAKEQLSQLPANLYDLEPKEVYPVHLRLNSKTNSGTNSGTDSGTNSSTNASTNQTTAKKP